MAKVIFSKDPEKFIPALATALKKMPEFVVPEWIFFVKSGVSKQRPPVSHDFWHLRAASILRQIYIQGVVGVGRLRIKYGSRKDRGGRPDMFKKAGGKIIRLILQQAEKAGLVEKVLRLQHGRRLTQKGKDLLDSIKVEEKKEIDYSSVSIKNLAKQEAPEDYEINEEVSEDEDGE